MFGGWNNGCSVSHHRCCWKCELWFSLAPSLFTFIHFAQQFIHSWKSILTKGNWNLSNDASKPLWKPKHISQQTKFACLFTVICLMVALIFLRRLFFLFFHWHSSYCLKFRLSSQWTNIISEIIFWLYLDEVFVFFFERQSSC